jgi:hypothetical protein
VALSIPGGLCETLLLLASEPLSGMFRRPATRRIT